MKTRPAEYNSSIRQAFFVPLFAQLTCSPTTNGEFPEAQEYNDIYIVILQKYWEYLFTPRNMRIRSEGMERHST